MRVSRPVHSADSVSAMRKKFRKDGETEEYYPSDIISLHKTEKRRHLWELSGIIAFSGIAVCTIVNFVTVKDLTWSLWADSPIFAAWIALTLILLAFRKYLIILPGLLVTVLTMLFLFDLFTPPVDWFFGIALPVTLSLSVAVGIVIFLWNIAHFKGFNILSIAFLILSGFCVVSEAFIDKYLFGKVEIHWSAIVAVSFFRFLLFCFLSITGCRKEKGLTAIFMFKFLR